MEQESEAHQLQLPQPEATSIGRRIILHSQEQSELIPNLPIEDQELRAMLQAEHDSLVLVEDPEVFFDRLDTLYDQYGDLFDAWEEEQDYEYEDNVDAFEDEDYFDIDEEDLNEAQKALWDQIQALEKQIDALYE